ncbi:DNA-binding protein H-NS [Variovorax sp. HW608]|uniref:H-NS family nucleoid-associated regulatory protein n=1 Tax=Variovorax sp. HW608 TaxID=1034889 RepID=UPI00081F9397|nr:H-NS family nucleoid-associated regulatory protein [Variovorax sp. HW608]SCK08869.1 DNA-binding protein H-NS [Variovorax sp. HW608]
MTQTYEQIQKQIEALQRQADSIREQEVAGVISRIKVAIAHYGLTAEQLGYGSKAKSIRATPKSFKSKDLKVGYSDGLGNSWSGRGPRPRWLRDALASGKTLEELAAGGLPNSTSKVQPSRVKSATKKRKSKVSYRDDAGHFWSGFGPRPKWLTEALAKGRTLEELAA